ncbi:MAG: MobP3 family relaxase [Clostridia bacterium]
MAKLIIKNSYLNSKSKAHIGNLVKYISTRDGVQKVFDVDKSVTENQKKLIDDLLKEFPTAKNSFEYEDYKLNPNSKTASDFIETAIEHNLDSIAKKENYVGYIANRPQVEKLAEHGLFSGTDENIDLKKVTDEIVNHKGCIWTPIISLKRDDASRVDFEDYESWKHLISANATECARAMKIHPDNFRWYAAFHQADSHPHIHMICYSTNPKEGYLTTTGIEKIKSKLMNEIFSQELNPLYQEKTIRRDKLKTEFKTAAENLQEKISSGNLDNPQLEFLMTELKEKLDNTTGKKVYGFLRPNVKELVDKIVDELEKIPEIENCYDLWWEIQQEIYSNYQDKIIKPLPLSKQTEFKSIKNMIISELIKEDNILSFENTQSENSIAQKESYTNLDFNKLALNILNSISRVFEAENKNFDKQSQPKIDSNAIREMRKRKQALGQKLDLKEMKL